MSSSAAVDAFTEAAERALAREDAKVWDCTESFLTLARSDATTSHVNAQLSRIAVDAIPESLGVGRRFCLRQRPGWSLVMYLVQPAPKPRKIYSSTQDRIITPLRDAEVVLHRWTQPEPEPLDVLDRHRHLVDPVEQVLTHGAATTLQATQDIAYLAAGTSAPVLVLESAPVYRLIWQYDLVTLEPDRLVAGSPDSSRIEYTALMLAEMGYAEAMPQLLALNRHPDHAVRWAAIRAVTHLDQSLGHSLLGEATKDHNPQVRAAAARVLRSY